MRQLKVLSLFDGLAGTRQALKELNIDCQYYASEIDKYAIKVAKANHSDIIHLGDVRDLEISIEPFDWSGTIKDEFLLPNGDLITTGCDRKNMLHTKGEFDLLIGGSPCQDLSIAKKDRKGLKGDRSSLFYEYLRILNEVRPKYFVLENVASMSKESKQEITKCLATLLTPNNKEYNDWELISD